MIHAHVCTFGPYSGTHILTQSKVRSAQCNDSWRYEVVTIVLHAHKEFMKVAEQMVTDIVQKHEKEAGTKHAKEVGEKIKKQIKIKAKGH